MGGAVRVTVKGQEGLALLQKQNVKKLTVRPQFRRKGRGERGTTYPSSQLVTEAGREAAERADGRMVGAQAGAERFEESQQVLVAGTTRQVASLPKKMGERVQVRGKLAGKLPMIQSPMSRGL